MTLETATYISDLLPTAPGSQDTRREGDDHIRLVKQVLQQTFANANRQYVLQNGAEKNYHVFSYNTSFSVSAVDDGSLYLIDCSSADILVTLPAASNGKSYTFIRRDGTTHTLTISGASLSLIDGAPTISISGNGSVRAIIEYGNNWITYLNLSTGGTIPTHSHIATDIVETATRIWFTPTERVKLQGIQEGAQVNPPHITNDLVIAGTSLVQSSVDASQLKLAVDTHGLHLSGSGVANTAARSDHSHSGWMSAFYSSIVVNTNTKTEICGHTVPADALDATGAVAEIEVIGSYLNNSGSSKTVAVEAVFGAATITKTLTITTTSNLYTFTVKAEVHRVDVTNGILYITLFMLNSVSNTVTEIKVHEAFTADWTVATDIDISVTLQDNTATYTRLSSLGFTRIIGIGATSSDIANAIDAHKVANDEHAMTGVAGLVDALTQKQDIDEILTAISLLDPGNIGLIGLVSSGQVQLYQIGTSSGTVCAGDDPRLGTTQINLPGIFPGLTGSADDIFTGLGYVNKNLLGLGGGGGGEGGTTINHSFTITLVLGQTDYTVPSGVALLDVDNILMFYAGAVQTPGEAFVILTSTSFRLTQNVIDTVVAGRYRAGEKLLIWVIGG